MAHTHALVPMSEIVDPLSLVDLCRISGMAADWIVDLVDEGILDPVGDSTRSWRFESTSITVVRKVQRLQGDLRLNIPGVALVLALAAENARLRRQIIQIDAEIAPAIEMPGPEGDA